jgi:hypothetical protein
METQALEQKLAELAELARTNGYAVSVDRATTDQRWVVRIDVHAL